MRLLDRYIVRSYLYNYLLAFGLLVGIYVLLDLVVNFDRFTKANAQVVGVQSGNLSIFLHLVGDISDYYMYQLLVIFQQVSAVIPVLAAGFTMVRMTRHNELTAMLASGVSLYRVALPIVLVAVGFSLLVVVDQEWLMPANADKLLRKHEDVSLGRSRSDPVFFLRDDGDNSLLTFTSYDPSTKTLKDVRISLRDSKMGGHKGRLMAPVAVWDAKPQNGPINGAWLLKDARQIDDTPNLPPTEKVAERTGDMYRSTKLTPEHLELVWSKKAVEYLSSAQVSRLWAYSPELTRPSLEKIMHQRYTQPLMNLIMLLLGIPFLLTREPRALMTNMFYCMGVSAICFVGTFVMMQMAGPTLPPMLGTWLPVLVFGPVSLVMLDFVKT